MNLETVLLMLQTDRAPPPRSSVSSSIEDFGK